MRFSLVPGSINPALWRRLDAAARAELSSLEQERDPELAAENWLAFAARQESAGRLEVAAELYAGVAESTAVVGPSNFEAPQSRARTRLDAILGRGACGPRAEFLLRHFAQESTDPTMIFAMGLAGAAFRLTRLATLSRLSAAPTANLFTRGFGARALAGITGFAVEAPTFTLAARFAGQTLGREMDWTLPALGRDLVSSFLVLGGLKAAGWTFGAASRYHGGSLVGRRPLQTLFQQGGMLTGILLGHALEEGVGLRRPMDGATNLVDSLALLLQFNIAGRLSRQAFGRGFSTWEQGLERQTELLAREAPTFRLPYIKGLGQRPVLAMAGTVPGPRSWVQDRFGANGIVKMSTIGDTPRPVASIPSLASLRAPEPPPAEYRLEYPPEIDALIGEVEAKIRQPNYFEGDRAELRAKRPSLETMDRIWFHQALDLLGRIPFVHTRMRGSEAFLEPLPGLAERPDVEFISRSVAGLSPEAHPASLQVLEVRFPRDMLTEYFADPSRQLESNLTTLSSLLEAQERLGPRLHLAVLHGEEFIARIPSLSLWENILHQAFGAEAAQIHPVEGTIPRDRIMALRERRIFPIGVSRHQLMFGDISEWAFPFSFGIHDGFFHGAIDAAARPGILEFSSLTYQWIQRRMPEVAQRESMLNGLSDSELALGDGLMRGKLPENLRQVLHRAREEAAMISDPEEAAQRRLEILRISEIWSRLMVSADSGSFADMVLRRDWEGFVSDLRTETEPRSVTAGLEVSVPQTPLQGVVVPPSFEYPPELEGIWKRMEARFSDPEYFQGSRSELLARRPAWEDVDRLWHFQLEDLARRIPGATWEYVDAEEISKIHPIYSGNPDPSLLPRALYLLGERGESGHPARRVLRVRIPGEFIEQGAIGLGEGPLAYLQVLPTTIDVEIHLRGGLGLMAPADGAVDYHFPSLSLFQAMYQGVHGPGSVEIFPVAGAAPRSVAARLRSLRLPPVGFARGLIYLGDVGYEIHPAGFTGHDVAFHAGRDASLPDPVPELAWKFYARLAAELPPHPISENILNHLSDLEFRAEEPRLDRQFYYLFTRNFHEASRDARALPADSPRRTLLEHPDGVNAALRRFIISEYRHHPGLAGNERYVIAALRDFGRGV